MQFQSSIFPNQECVRDEWENTTQGKKNKVMIVESSIVFTLIMMFLTMELYGYDEIFYEMASMENHGFWKLKTYLSFLIVILI